MKFDVLGRNVNVGWSHLAVCFLSLIAYVVIIFAVTVPLAYLFYTPLKYASELGGFGVVLVQGAGDYGRAISSIVGAPLVALILLLVATRLYKMTKDAALCRSLAGAGFFLEVGVYLFVFIPATTIFLLNPVAAPSGFASFFWSWLLGPVIYIVEIAGGAILLYLWLLAIAAPDRQKANKTVAPAALFGVVIAALPFLPLLLDVTVGRVVVDFGTVFATLQTVIYFLSQFVFGFIVLYHLKGKKLDNAAYLFAALFIASPLFMLLEQLLVPGTMDPWATLTAMIKLALLYGLSRIDLKDIL